MSPDPTATDAPLYVASVTLAVRDLELVADFYRSVIGLADIERSSRRLSLGADGQALLELVHRPAARIAEPGGIGLFHTAFLLPSRADLGRWLTHAAETGVRLDGASDHGVSEAVYLTDPEGNGIEIYADRSRHEWPSVNGALHMTTRRLTLPEVMRAGEARRWTSAPTGTRIGHIHLAVATLEASESFYRDVIGLDRMVRLPSASFLASGGYHHHVAVNTWHTAGVAQRGTDTTGLEGFTLRSHGADLSELIRERALRTATPLQADGGTIAVFDPSGLRVAIGEAR